MTKIGFVSLGCSKNRCDTEVMLAQLSAAGYEITPEETEADIIIINTCAFIESAKQEAIDNILDIAYLKEHHKLRGIIVAGCLAQRYGSEVLDELPEVDALIGVGSIGDIVDAVRAVEKRAAEKDSGKDGRYISVKDKNICPMGGDRVLTTPGYTAYIKIAEGCDNCCTYCAIPSIRGRFRSRPMEDILREARELEALGVKELCVIAQDTSRYGLDIYGEYRLAALLRALCRETEKIRWIRVLYCYPDKITDELIDTIRDEDKIVKYIDLPIQHISESILRRMNRHGGSDTVRDAVRRLRAGVPGIVIRSTAIVGFPGETEEEFCELCGFIREAQFDRFGAFTYSREEGTPAADFEGQIDEQLKQDRYDILMREQLAVSEEKIRAAVGKTQLVICEGYDPVAGLCYGRGCVDAPEIDGKIYFSAKEKPEPGTFVNVAVTEALDYDLIGRMVSSAE